MYSLRNNEGFNCIGQNCFLRLIFDFISKKHGVIDTHDEECGESDNKNELPTKQNKIWLQFTLAHNTVNSRYNVMQGTGKFFTYKAKYILSI